MAIRAESENLNAVVSPNLRMVVSMERNEKSLIIIDSGVSEDPFSKHYDDMMMIHNNGEYILHVDPP
jgi:acyl-homoserine lactone acylase PvdQ